MDEKDRKILEALKENSRLSTQKIAKRTEMPITTVYHRMKRMEKLGIIKGYTTVLDYKKIGKPITAYVLITVDYKLLKALKMSQHELAQKIKTYDLVEETSIVTGGTDIIIKIRVRDIDQMSDFVTKQLRNVDGVENTQTLVVLSEV